MSSSNTLDDLLSNLETMAYHRRWHDAKHLVQRHQALLLSDQAHQALCTLIDACDPDEYYDSMRVDELREVQALVRDCRSNGIDEAFARLLVSETRLRAVQHLPRAAIAQLLRVRSTIELNTLVAQYPLLDHIPALSLAKMMQFLHDVLQTQTSPTQSEQGYRLVADNFSWLEGRFTDTLQEWQHQGIPETLFINQKLLLDGVIALRTILEQCPYGEHSKNVVVAHVCHDFVRQHGPS